MDKVDIIKHLEKHLKWLKDEEGGEKFDLRKANLTGANLYGADLRKADLYGADLRKANLYGADLTGADLRKANLYEANLTGANLYGANLTGANLTGANLYGANLTGANIRIFHGGQWIAFIDPEFIRIGCKFFKVSEWESFSDEIIDKMSIGALDYWKENKEIIMSISKKLQERRRKHERTVA